MTTALTCRIKCYTFTRFDDTPEAPYTRPDADTVYLLAWPREDLAIEWPEGMTLKQAILAWAKEQ